MMASILLSNAIAVLALLAASALAFYDAGDATIYTTTPAYVPTAPHHLLPTAYEPWTKARPSMITAIAPSMALMGHGVPALEYSVHFNNPAAARHQHGHGLFKRGVFANDPPLSTCQQCDNNGRPITSPSGLNGTGFTSTPCSTIPYSGIFRSPAPSSSFCFNPTYSGVFESTTSSALALPCCSSTSNPSSCLANSTRASSLFSSGIFVSSTTFVSNFTTSTYTQTSSISLSLSSTSRSSSSSSSSTSSSSSSSSSSSLSSSSSTSSPSSLSSSLGASSGSLSSILSSVSSVIVISSTTIIVSASSNSVSGPISSTQNTITVITATPSGSANPTFELGPNSVTGCGTASGCGTVVGSGTVYAGPGGLIPVVSSGTASGCASTVIGCGTMIATTGKFTGTAIITGCGEGYGYATMTGEGTVWPAALGGLVSFVSSGVVTGSGRVKGCGTITGTGTFTASEAYTRTFSPSATGTRTTVEVYVSYCPTTIPGGGLPRMGGNLTSPLLDVNGTSLANTTQTSTTQDSETVPACRECPNSAGICCPPNAKCDELGKCPWSAMEAMGYIRFGINMVNWRNTSDGGYLADEEKEARLGTANGQARKRSGSEFEGMGRLDTGPMLAQRERELKEAKMKQPKQPQKRKVLGQGYLVGGDA